MRIGRDFCELALYPNGRPTVSFICIANVYYKDGLYPVSRFHSTDTLSICTGDLETNESVSAPLHCVFVTVLDRIILFSIRSKKNRIPCLFHVYVYSK